MADPLVAIVGRPNVGKSTLINRIARGRQAIVHATPGVTRDRNYIEADWAGRSFVLVDTGGIGVGEDQPMQSAIKSQAMEAISESDVIIFMVDGRSGVVTGDDIITDTLRRCEKPVIFVANKVDNPGDVALKYDFFSLGLGEPIVLSAAHGLGVGELLDEIIKSLPPVREEKKTTEPGIAIVGRPNVGKSSIFNRLVRDDRVVVSDVPGTTRDSIDVVAKWGGQDYRFIDTAGLRKVSKLSGDIEYYGTLRAVRALERAEIALIVIDANEGITVQDQKIVAISQEKKCASIIILNKWDLVGDEESQDRLMGQVGRKLSFMEWAILARVSAVSGRGIGKLPELINTALDSYHMKFTTKSLNDFLSDLSRGYIPTRRGKALKLKYITQTDQSPPTFLFFVNDPGIVDNAYKRYLGKQFRERFLIKGTPIFFNFRREKK